MNDPAEIQVNFYDSLKNIVCAEPYAVLSHGEVSSMWERLDSWVSIIASHPNLVDMLGDSITAHIKMVTALRVAVRESRQAGFFPNVIFPPTEYQATMNFLAETRGKKGVS